MKILLADDHMLFRDAVASFIRKSQPSAVIQTAGTLAEAEEALGRGGAQDLIMLDLYMPGMNGFEGIRKITRAYPGVPVAVISGLSTPENVQQAVDSGACAFFPKTLSGRALIRAIQLVLEGEPFFPREQSPFLHQDLEPGEHLSPAFTPREKDVLQQLVKGASNKDIAGALGVQVVTVKLHVRSICRKLEAKNRTQAALRAKQYGFYDAVG